MTVTHIRGIDSALLQRARRRWPHATTGVIVNQALQNILDDTVGPGIEIIPAKEHDLTLVETVDYGQSGSSLVIEARS